MSRRGGAVIQSTLRLLLAPRYTAVRQLELKNGLRLTPVAATSFAIVHRRNYASSTNSTDDDQNKLEKHKKERENNEIKVVWEKSKRLQKQKKALEFKHRPDDGLAIRAEEFRKHRVFRKMTEDYEMYKKTEDMYMQRKQRRLQKQQQAKEAEEKAMAKIKKWKENQRNSDSLKLINKIVWNVFKWKKSSDNETRMQQKYNKQVKKSENEKKDTTKQKKH